MNNKLVVVFAVLFVASGAAAAVFWQKASRLAAEKQQTEAQATALEQEVEAARGEVKRRSDSSASELEKQKSELLRLRNEVTMLRGNSQEVSRLQVENKRLVGEVDRVRREANARAAQQAQRPAMQSIPVPQFPGQQPGVPQPGQVAPGQVAPQQQGNDPLAFYRKNPELMKRYFPHLATNMNATAGVDANGNTVIGADYLPNQNQAEQQPDAPVQQQFQQPPQ